MTVKVGDRLLIREFNDAIGKYTGREIYKRITFILEGIGPGAISPLKGLAREYCILSLAD